jgi:signal transduction histidine kinase
MGLAEIKKFDFTELTSCDREPIHIPGSFQPRGALPALDPSDLWTVHASGDTDRLPGAAVALPDTNVGDVLNPDNPLLPRGETLARGQKCAVHRQSTPWLASEIDAAHQHPVSLLKVEMPRIDQLARQRRSARLVREGLMHEPEASLKRWQDAARTPKQESERRTVAEADLCQVLRRTVEDQEAGRLRTARELHDTLGPSLTHLRLGLEGLTHASPDEAELTQRIANIKGRAADVGGEVSRPDREIRPTALDDLGVQNAIQSLLDRWREKSNVKSELHLALGEQRLPPVIETTLYRVLQEALTNVVRHTNAANVSVVLRLTDHCATLIVENDGRGFGDDIEPIRSETWRLGLLGIRERLVLVGGSLEIESSPGKGATLFARIPVKQ